MHQKVVKKSVVRQLELEKPAARKGPQAGLIHTDSVI